MELDKGEVLAILGESGIGKSTMLRIIAGLEEAHKGSMTIGDKIIFSEKLFVEPKNRGIGMVFQDYALFPKKQKLLLILIRKIYGYRIRLFIR